MRDFIARLCCFLAATTLAILPCLSAPPHLSVVARKNAGGGGGGTPADYTQDFEGTGAPTGWSNVGTVDWDYEINGSQSCATLGKTNDQDVRAEYVFGSSPTTYIEMRVRIHVVAFATSTRVLVNFMSGTTTIATCYMTATGGIQVAPLGGSAPFSVGEIPLGESWYMWFRFVKGSGSNAVLTAAFASTDSRPTSGDFFVASTDGTDTRMADRVRLNGDHSGASNAFDIVWDDLAIWYDKDIP